MKEGSKEKKTRSRTRRKLWREIISVKKKVKWVSGITEVIPRIAF